MAKVLQKGWQTADDLFFKYRSNFLWAIAFCTVLFFVSISLALRDSLTTISIVWLSIASIVVFLLGYAFARGIGRGIVPNAWMKVDLSPKETAALIEEVLEQERVPNVRRTFKGYDRSGRNMAVLRGIRNLPADMNGFAFDLWDGARVIVVSPEPPRGSKTDIVVHPRKGKNDDVIERVKARIGVHFMLGNLDQLGENGSSS
jgi:hypothetical protein